MSSKRAVFHQAVLEEDTLAGWISDAVKSTSPPWSDGSFEDRRSYSVGARRSQPRIMKRTTIVMMTDWCHQYDKVSTSAISTYPLRQNRCQAPAPRVRRSERNHYSVQRLRGPNILIGSLFVPDLPWLSATLSDALPRLANGKRCTPSRC